MAGLTGLFQQLKQAASPVVTPGLLGEVDACGIELMFAGLLCLLRQQTLTVCCCQRVSCQLDLVAQLLISPHRN